MFCVIIVSTQHSHLIISSHSVLAISSLLQIHSHGQPLALHFWIYSQCPIPLFFAWYQLYFPQSKTLMLYQHCKMLPTSMWPEMAHCNWAGIAFQLMINRNWMGPVPSLNDQNIEIELTIFYHFPLAEHGGSTSCRRVNSVCLSLQLKCQDSLIEGRRFLWGTFSMLQLVIKGRSSVLWDPEALPVSLQM